MKWLLKTRRSKAFVDVEDVRIITSKDGDTDKG